MDAKVLSKFCPSEAWRGQRTWGSLRRAGPQETPKTGQRSKLRSKAREAGPALTTRGRRGGPEAKEGRGDSEGLTVICHHRVPLVMLLSRPQMMLYALKLWGQRGECSKRSHLLFRNHHFLLAGRRHFRFRLGGCPQERARQIPPISPLLSDSEATTG